MTDLSSSPKQPLGGVRVVDFTSIVAGPWATRLLADCGAEVIKIEAVGDGDILRFAPPVNDGMSRVYAHFNRGKKSVTLDLKTPGGLEVARGLIASADVLVENFRPGVMARLGLDYETIAKAHPRLVYCSISGYGQSGPDAGKAAYAPVVHAASGFDHVMAAAQGGDGAPLNGGVMIADYLAAIYAFGAIQTALLHRERNGVGSHVDVTLIESIMSLLAIQFQEAQSEQALASRVFTPMKAADGHVVVPLVSLKSYLSVYDVIGRSAWRMDPDYCSMAGVARRRLEIEAVLRAWVATQSTKQCVAALTAAGVACSAYAAPADLFDDPHLAHRGVFAELNDARGRFTVLNPPFRLSGVPCGAEAAVARAGQDTEETVRETLQLSGEEFRELERGGAFG
jgi:crotonobetainyl-CoA:carnitine CoA-transferase CaiB-like acyl-CoA transferase